MLKGGCCFDLQNNKVYWIDRRTGFLQKANLEVQTFRQSQLEWFGRLRTDLDVSNGHAYYGDYSNNTSNGQTLMPSIENLVTTSLSYPWGHLGCCGWQQASKMLILLNLKVYLPGILISRS